MFSVLKNIFGHRFLLWQFIRADILGRYKGTYLGILWIILSPLLVFFLYVFIFSVVLKVRFPEQEGVLFYGLNLFCGLIAWTAFAESLIRSSSVILSNRNLVKRTLFPSEIFGLSMTVSSMLRFVIELTLFILVIAFLKYKITWAFCWLPFLILLQLLFTVSLAWIVSALSVLLRDLSQLIGLLLTAWFFMTPVVYPESMALVPKKWWFLAGLIHINPMSKFISTYRAIVLHGYFDFTSQVVYLIVFVMSLFILSAWFFNSVKPELVENL
ncbi:MAG: ABC transporter permease [Candidatus Omnitrophica bacterium]|nr:ABC transporter permease [Candidatus Omnitrophota bacterium]